MSRIITVLSLGLSLILLPAVVSTASAKRPQKVSKVRKEKKLDFRAYTVEGGRVTPTGDEITGRGVVKHPSLISLRTNFMREMLRSAENL